MAQNSTQPTWDEAALATPYLPTYASTVSRQGSQRLERRDDCCGVSRELKDASTQAQRVNVSMPNNLIEQDHRSIKLRLGPTLGFKRFRNASITIAGIELVHRIKKGQYSLEKLRVIGKTASEIWTAVLAA